MVNKRRGNQSTIKVYAQQRNSFSYGDSELKTLIREDEEGLKFGLKSVDTVYNALMDSS